MKRYDAARRDTLQYDTTNPIDDSSYDESVDMIRYDATRYDTTWRDATRFDTL